MIEVLTKRETREFVFDIPEVIKALVNFTHKEYGFELVDDYSLVSLENGRVKLVGVVKEERKVVKDKKPN